jgi:hypothetical protein
LGLAVHLRCVFNHFIFAYDGCGEKIGCFELADPAGLRPPYPGLAYLRDWKGVRILHIEVKNDIQEFFTALETAAFRATDDTSARACRSNDMHGRFEEVIFDVFGPRLFRAVNLECDLCGVLKRSSRSAWFDGKSELDSHIVKENGGVNDNRIGRKKCGC